MMQIRTATQADAGQVAAISRETFYESFAAQNTRSDMDIFLSEQFTTQKLAAEVGAQGNHFLLVYEDELLAGYVKLQEGGHPVLQGENALEIARIYVRRSFAGMGFGKALMEASITLAARMGKEWIWLGVWEHNSHAIQFYTSYGFEKFSEHDFLLGRDLQRDWLMKRATCLHS